MSEAALLLLSLSRFHAFTFSHLYMHRAYAENKNLSQEDIVHVTDPDEIHHIRDVLRLNCNEELIVFNGKGEEATAKIESISKKDLALRIIKLKQSNPSVSPYIILACAIPKKDKFEWIIEKATELGVMEIIPVKTARTEFKMKPERLQKKEGRYKTVAINATKQCQRLTVPEIHPVSEFKKCLEQLISSNIKIILPCLINDRLSLKKAAQKHTTEKMAVFIGPEGDFTEEEVAFAISKGAVPVSLGDTVLKVETAAISSVAAIKLFCSGE